VNRCLVTVTLTSRKVHEEPVLELKRWIEAQAPIARYMIWYNDDFDFWERPQTVSRPSGSDDASMRVITPHDIVDLKILIHTLGDDVESFIAHI